MNQWESSHSSSCLGRVAWEGGGSVRTALEVRVSGLIFMDTQPEFMIKINWQFSIMGKFPCRNHQCPFENVTELRHQHL